MYLNYKASVVFVCSIFLFVLWIILERRNAKIPWRVGIGLSFFICVSLVVISLCQLVTLTREHSFRTALFNLSHEAAAGHTNLVWKLLLDYGRDHKNARYIDDMTAVNNLCLTMTQIHIMRRENNRDDSGSTRGNKEEEFFIQRNGLGVVDPYSTIEEARSKAKGER